MEKTAMNARSVALLVFALVAVPAIAAKRVTVQQLDQVVVGLKGQPDEKVTRILSGLESTDRVSAERLSRWMLDVQGKSSRQALTVLADASMFMNPPAEEMPKMAPIDKDAQQKLFEDASAYVLRTLAKLPNFFATEAIVFYGNRLPESENVSANADLSMHYQSRRKINVLYRGGKEVMQTHSGEVLEQDQRVSKSYGLLSSGEFGPVLNTVLADAQKGKLTWGHWEMGVQGDNSAIAVFRYSVPRRASHYKVVLEKDGKHPEARPGYHGEIGIDPKSGTIMRLTLLADLIDDDPLSMANLMVEYAPVEIGDVSYICPVRSVAIVSLKSDDGGRGIVSRGFGMGLHDGSYGSSVADAEPTPTILNDVTFESYHILRSDVRMVTDADPSRDQN